MPNPPVPTALRVLQGNPGRRALPKSEPKPSAPAKFGAPPGHLNTAARAEWRRMGPELLRLGLYTVADRAQFSAYCQAWGRWVEAEEGLKRHGPVVMTPNGMPVVSPYLSMANRALEQLHRFASEFGMSPSSRTRVSAVPVDDEDEHPIMQMLRKQREQGGA